MKFGRSHTLSLGPFGLIWLRATCRIGLWVWFRGRQRYFSFPYARS